MITLDNFDGHLILYCKNLYNVPEVDLLLGFRRIWAIRCGYDYRDNDKSADIYIANCLYRIIEQTCNHLMLQELLHENMEKGFFYIKEDLTAIERIIWFYRSRIVDMSIRDGKKILVKLPKPKKQLFKRIIRGNGGYNDYKLIT